MKLKNDVKTHVEGIILLVVSAALQAVILYTIFAGRASFILLLPQLTVIAFFVYAYGFIYVSRYRITILQEGISINYFRRNKFLQWNELPEIGFVDIMWTKPSTQYVYFSKELLTQECRDRLGTGVFPLLISGVFTSVTPAELPYELHDFLTYWDTSRQCYSEGKSIHAYKDSRFNKIHATSDALCTLMDLILGLQLVLTGYVLCGLNDLLSFNTVPVVICYVFSLLYELFFVKKTIPKCRYSKQQK